MNDLRNHHHLSLLSSQPRCCHLVLHKESLHSTKIRKQTLRLYKVELQFPAKISATKEELFGEFDSAIKTVNGLYIEEVNLAKMQKRTVKQLNEYNEGFWQTKTDILRMEGLESTASKEIRRNRHKWITTFQHKEGIEYKSSHFYATKRSYQRSAIETNNLCKMWMLNNAG